MSEQKDIFPELTPKACERMHRVVLRVVTCEPGDPIMRVKISAWDGGRENVAIPRDRIPPSILPKLKAGSRLFARVNIGAEGLADLRFEAFELPLRMLAHPLFKGWWR